MKPLIIINGAGPTQANFVSASKLAWPGSVVLDIRDQGGWVRPSEPLPVWASVDVRQGDQTLRRRYFAAVMSEHGLDSVIAVSGDAVLWAGEALPGVSIDAVIMRGELDFSLRRTGLVNKFRRVAQLAKRLWLESWYEMDKAAAMGSQVPHYLLPAFTVPMRILASEGDSARIMAVVPEAWGEGDVSRWHHNLLNASGGSIGVDVITAESLYSATDLRMRRGFPGTCRYRVPSGATHAVVLGSGPHHFAVISALAATSAGRLFVDSTINNRAVTRAFPEPTVEVASGAALVERVVASAAAWRGRHFDETPTVDENPLREAFDRAQLRSVPFWHEEGMVEENLEEFDVFFTTAGVEDRADGARPQRIRAMSEHFLSDVPVVRLSSNRSVLRRRSRAVAALMQDGVRPRFGYGENSTAPMDPAALDDFSNTLRGLRSFGMRAAWFVRDLHWLTTEADYSQITPEDLSKTRTRGLRELNEMRALSDVMFAPSAEAGAEFDRLLNEAGVESEIDWVSLPPGLSSSNVLAREDPPNDGVLRLVYTGGFGGVYAFGPVMHAVSLLQVPWTLDLVIRQADLGVVEEAVSNLPPDRVAISVSEFKDYVPRQGVSVGIALLDSGYGMASFPFKTISYLEKKMPVLCFEGSSIESFLAPYGAAVVVGRQAEEIARGMSSVFEVGAGAGVDWEELEASESWSSRAARVRLELSAVGS